MKKVIFVLPLLLIVNGCAAVSNLEEIQTLQKFSDETEETDEYVTYYDKTFDRLIAAVEDQSIKYYSDKESILKGFVEPIQRKAIVRNNEPHDQWLYRRSVHFFNSAKVYLIFDNQDHLVDYVYEPFKEE